MKNTKYILLALVLSLGLTSCNNLSQNTNNKEETAQTEVSEENKDAKDTKDEKKDSKEDKDSKKDTDKKTSDKDEGMEDVDEEELREELKNLEDSLFENKVQVRACEILMEENPELVADIRGDLEGLLEESNASVEASEELIRQVKEYLGEE
ncbi:hypothetical protein [Anaerococcus prevotii]|uniref:Putative lipoprotein n=1 Tax=Anaerococcus prevotii ACS-065-V-Col13 TaxID=879305 RepID=F0GU06_9FIRM|nr:hypothetical protein [Anaerococcus prevotii]EGC82687.1 putative lipoprotein [Anaerococcus prevotii ACS-065-V-Col13]